MIRSKISEIPIYTVVDVYRGVAVDAQSFKQLRDAHIYAQKLTKKRNLQEDDVQIFKVYAR